MKINKAKVGAAYKRESVEALAAIEKEKPEAIEKWLSGEEKEYLASGKRKIERDMVEIEETAEGFAVARFEGGKVYLKTEMKKELYEEAMVREIARRVQLMRKEKKLVESDRIVLHIETDDKELSAIAKKHTDSIASQVNAELVGFTHYTGGFRKEWEIDEAKITLTIEKK